MPIKEIAKAIAAIPSRITGAIGRKVERASRTTRHKLARIIVRRRWRLAFLLASTWLLWLSTAFLVWLALTSENPGVRPWLHSTKVWVVAAGSGVSLFYTMAQAERRWELHVHRQRYRKARKR